MVDKKIQSILDSKSIFDMLEKEKRRVEQSGEDREPVRYNDVRNYKNWERQYRDMSRFYGFLKLVDEKKPTKIIKDGDLKGEMACVSIDILNASMRQLGYGDVKHDGLLDVLKSRFSRAGYTSGVDSVREFDRDGESLICFDVDSIHEPEIEDFGLDSGIVSGLHSVKFYSRYRDEQKQKTNFKKFLKSAELEGLTDVDVDAVESYAESIGLDIDMSDYDDVEPKTRPISYSDRRHRHVL